MAVCGSCNSGARICSCVFETDGSTSLVIGNGSVASPIAFNKSAGPTPRPIMDIGRVVGNPAVTVPINTNTIIPLTTNLLSRDGTSVDGGWTVDLITGRATCTVAGPYIVGGMVRFTGQGVVAGDNRRDLRISEGVPAGANVYAVESQQIIGDASSTPAQSLSCCSLVNLAVGNYLEMWVFSTIADSVLAGASAHMYAIWMGP